MKELYLEKLIAFGGKLILESNLHIQDCSQITEENMFLLAVLAGWCKINNSESTHVIAKKIMWNNSQMKYNNKILFYHDWHEKRIKVIEHIYDFRIHKLYTLEQLQNLYNIHQKDFLKYYNIVYNILKEWKNKLKDENYNNLP